MKNFSNWFSRCQGDWKSYRRYLTLPAMKDNSYTTEFSIAVDGDDISVRWDGEASKGVMNLEIDGDVLHRDIGYFSENPNDSQMLLVDEDTLVLLSSYDGMHFREEIRLVNGDRNRLRQTVGYKANEEPFIVGQYWEVRSS